MDREEYDLMNRHDRGMWWYYGLHMQLIKFLPSADGTLLDAGCGTGGFLQTLRESKPNLMTIGIELDRRAAEMAAVKSRSLIVQGDVNLLPFADRSIDILVSADVLGHGAVSVQDFFAEARRVLRPGGQLLFNVPAHAWLHSEHDRRVHNARRFSRSELCDLLARNDFIHARVCFWNVLLFPLMILKRKIVRSERSPGSDVKDYGRWTERIFRGVMDLERCLPIGRLPGGSLIGTANTPRYLEP